MSIASLVVPSAGANVPVISKASPVVMAVDAIPKTVPVVTELAVIVNGAEAAPVEVRARTALEVSLLEIATTSLAVAGDRVVVDLDQNPTVLPEPPVMLPVQFKAPVVPPSVIVQRVLVPSVIVIVPPSARRTLVDVSLR